MYIGVLKVVKLSQEFERSLSLVILHIFLLGCLKQNKLFFKNVDVLMSFYVSAGPIKTIKNLKSQYNWRANCT